MHRALLVSLALSLGCTKANAPLTFNVVYGSESGAQHASSDDVVVDVSR